MRLSIAMASYNGARFIGEQLESFAAQTILPDELIVTDDGSTDGTVEIVEQFASSAPFPVRIHRNPERLDYARNFEAAIRDCTGDIIFLSDQDDVWFPEKLEVVRDAFLAADETLVLANDQLLTDGQLGHAGITKLDNLRRLGQGSDGLIEGCCTAFRRTWGELLFPFPANAALLRTRALSHDRWLNELSILLRVRAVIERPLQYFRRYGENTTSWVVSEPRKIGARELVRLRHRRAPVEAWLERIEVLDTYRQWLTANEQRLAEMGIATCKSALETIAKERESLQTRATLVRLRLPRRLIEIARLWRCGGYELFYGWKSAVRDIVRTA